MNKHYQIILPLTILFLWLTLPLAAQSPCITFDNLEKGKVFSLLSASPIDQVIVKEPWAIARLRPFTTLTTAIGNKAVVVDPDSLDEKFPKGDKLALQMLSANVEFDFSTSNTVVGSLCLDFFSLEGVKNISVNGEPILVLKTFEQLNDSTFNAGKIRARVEIEASGNGQTGRICIDGPIKTLLIGGEHLVIDNLCIQTTTTNDVCQFKELAVYPLPCTPNGIFYAQIKFDAEHGGEKGYFVKSQGKVFGPFSYDEAFPKIGPIQLTNTGVYDFTVYDAINPDCQISRRIQYNCGPVCPLEGRIYAKIEICDGVARLVIEDDPNLNFKDLGLDSSMVAVEFEGFKGYFDLDQLPFQYPLPVIPASGLVLKIKVCLPQLPDCCLDIIAKIVECPDDDCIQFERLPIGKKFGKGINKPGEIIFTEDSVFVSLDSFLYDNGTKGYEYVEVVDSLFPSFFPNSKKHALFVSNINLKFDFTREKDVKGPVRKVCFDFADGGGEENIRVNQGKTYVVKDLSELDKDTLAEGVVAYFVPGTPGTLRNGTLCLVGKIDSVFIGGQEFGLDNVCFDREEDPSGCKLSEVKVYDLKCDSTGNTYSLSLSLKADNAADSLTVSIPAVKYKKRVAVKDLPARLEGIPLNPASSSLLEILEVCADKYTDDDSSDDLSECCAKIRYQVPCRPPVCAIRDLKVYDLKCDSLGRTYGLTLNLVAENTRDTLTVYLPGGMKKRVAAKDFPARFEGIPVLTTANSLWQSIEVCGERQPGSGIEPAVVVPCCAGIRFEVPCKPLVCSIRDLKVYDLKCDSLGRTYGLTLNLVAENAGDTLTVYLPGGMKKRVAVKDFPVRLEGIPGFTTNSLIDVIEVCADRQPYPYPTTDPAGFAPCCASIRFETPCKPQLCSITGVKVDDIKCSEDGKSYSATLYWTALNAGDSLVIETNSGFRKVVAAKASPIRLENIPVPANATGAAIYVCSFLKIYPPCCGSIKFELPCRPQPCSISDLKVTEIECIATGTTRHYNLTLNLKAVNAGDSLFVTTNSGFKKKIANKFPVRLTGIPFGQDSKYGILEVCSATPLTVYCCNKIQYELPCPPACAIRDMKVFDVQCDPEKKVFSFSVNLIAQNPGEVLYLETDGGFITKIDPNKLPARIENVPFGPEAGWATIKVCASSADDCCAKLRFPVPCAAPCSISDLKVSEIECITYGIFPHYNLTLNLKAVNAGDSLIVSTDSGFKRKIANKFPARLTGIPFGQDLKFGILEVCSSTPLTESCCNKIRYELPCYPPCAIRDLKVFDVKCDPAKKVYSFSVNLVAQNPGEVLYLETDGGFITKIDPKKLPARIENVPYGPEAGWATIKVCGSNTDDCCAKLRFPVPCTLPCDIRDLKAYDVKCNPEKKTFSFSLNVIAQNPGEALYLITDGGFQTKIDPAKLPARIENVPYGPEAGWATIKVCGSNVDDCCAKLRFPVPCAIPVCSIRDLKVFDIKCSEDGKFYSLSLNLVAQNAGDSLVVTTDSGFKKVIPSNKWPYRLEGIPSGNYPYAGILEVCAYKPSATAPCCEKIKYELPCRPQCSISDLKPLEIKCSADGKSYSMSLAFKAVNAPDSLLVETLSGYRKVISSKQSPVRLENIPVGNDTQFGILTLCALSPSSVQQCCDKIRFELPCRTQTCDLGDLLIERTRCDEQGKYSFFLKFEHKNTSDSFLVLINGAMKGKFAYSQLPVKFGPFQGPLTQPMNITVYDSQNRACSSFGMIQPFRCENVCSLTDLKVFDIKCNNNGTYNLRLKLNAQNGSEVLTGKTSTGYQFRFRTDEMPVKVEGIPVPRDGYDVIKVCDPNYPDCCVELRYKVPCQEPCYLGPLTAEQLCQPNGLYFVRLNFGYNNTGKQFEVYVNGINYGIFTYDKLPVKVGPFFQTNVRELKILVKDKALGCSTSTVLPVEPCAGSCSFNNLKAEVLSCENGKFYAGLSFQAPQADSSRAYLVFANGRIYGPYRYSQNPVKLGPFNANGVTQYSFLVIDLANPTCYAYTTIKPVRCAGEECKIGNLVVKPIDCKPDGSQRVLIDFDHSGAEGGSFALSMNNGFIGNFDIDKLPLEVVVRKPLITTSDRLVEFSVCIRGTTNCCASVKTDLLECPVACREPEVAFDRKDCDSTGVFSVSLKADDSLDSNFFYAVFVDGNLRDTLNGANRIVEIGPFKGDSATIYKIEVVSYGLQRCVKTFKVGPIACNGKSSEDVWPGDANQDNTANHIDLLNIGMAFGAQGPARKEKSDQWKAFTSADWKEKFLTGQNFKHADANGDGVVDEEDIKVVTKNYGKKHGVPQPAEELPGTNLDPAIQLELPNGPLPAKGFFEIPIKLGSKANPVKDIYGLAFILKVDPAVIDLNKVDVVVPISWMGQPGVNMAHIHKVYPAEGMIEIAISRIDQNEVSGYGVIAYLRGGIKDDIAGRSSDMSIRHGAAVRLNQETVPIQGSLMQLQIAPPSAETTETPTPESIKPGLSIFPNPLTGDQLRIEHRLGMAIEEVQLLSIDGKPATPAFRETNRVDLAGMPAGMYIVRIKVGGFNFFEKLIRQ